MISFLNWDLGGNIVFKKKQTRPGFILASSLITLWLISLCIVTYCSIDLRARQQEDKLVQTVELSSKLVSRSNLLLDEKKSKQKQMIEVKNDKEKLFLEFKKEK